MRLRKIQTALAILSPALGMILLLVGFFAYSLGLDNNPLMGAKRRLLAGAGILLLLLPPLIRLTAGWVRRNLLFPLGQMLRRWRLNPLLQEIDRAADAAGNTRIAAFFREKAAFWTVLACTGVFIAALWYLTAGTLTQWTPYSHYFDLQAEGFLHGSLALLEEPPPGLALLPDPYDWKAREGLGYIWDASYYRGKYYYYWGPVPALAAAAIKIFTPVVIEDQLLVLIFYAGLVFSFAALLYWLRREFFPAVPAWVLFPLVTACGLSTPVFWLINRPKVYEAAIAAAQFFLVLGLYAAARGLHSTSRPGAWLTLAGFAWGASVGSRYTYAAAVIGMSLVVSFVLLKRWRVSGRRPGSTFAFLLPLVLWAAGLAWFNDARFGSILETGLSYQLTGEALPDDPGLLMSAGYLIPNLYLSVLHPLEFNPAEFPFFFAPYISETMWPAWVSLPRTYYYTEPVVGILSSMPVFFLLLVLLFPAVSRIWRWVCEQPSGQEENPTLIPGWLWLLVGAGFLFAFLPLMVFVMATMRYLADFVPVLMALVSLVVFNELDRCRSYPWKRRLLSLLLLLLCAATVGIGLLINFRNGDKRFEMNNPRLYYEIARFFMQQK